MEVARAGHCALSVEDKIIVFGGVSDGDGDLYSSSIECFDGHIWSKKGNMHQPRFYICCKFYLKNLIRYGATGSVVNGAAFGMQLLFILSFFTVTVQFSAKNKEIKGCCKILALFLKVITFGS